MAQGKWIGNKYEITIDKLWNGHFSIRSDTIDRIYARQGWLIAHLKELGKTVEIHWPSIKKKIVSTSPLQDSKFNQPYRFCYFDAREPVDQIDMFDEFHKLKEVE